MIGAGCYERTAQDARHTALSVMCAATTISGQVTLKMPKSKRTRAAAMLKAINAKSHKSQAQTRSMPWLNCSTR